MGGNSASPQPEPEASRTVISHRAVDDDYSSDTDDEVVPGPAGHATANGTTNGNGAILASKTALMEAAVDEYSSDEEADADKAELVAAAMAAVARDGSLASVEDALETLGGHAGDLDVDIDVDVDVNITEVPETQATSTISGTAPETGRGRKATKSASATPAAKTKPVKKSEPSTAGKVEFAGQVGPDTSVDVKGETHWELERIAGAENDGKTLLVKWKGWKGFWEEDRDNIANSAPGLVEAFEKKLKADKDGRRGKKAAATTTGKGRAKTGAGVKKSTPIAAATAQKAAGAKRGRKPGSRPATASEPKAVVKVDSKKASASSPKTNNAPAKKFRTVPAPAVPKSPVPATKRGPPKKRGPVAAAAPAKASAEKGKAKTGAGIKKTKASPAKRKTVKAGRGRPRKS